MRTLRAARTAGLLGFLCLPLLAATSAPAGLAGKPFAVVVPSPARPPSNPTPRSTESGAQAAPDRKAQPRRAGSGGPRDTRAAFHAASSHAGLKPASGSALLSELTKPAYLLVRLLATPTNHRAPPA